MRSKKLRRYLWVNNIYDYTNTKIKSYLTRKGIKYMIGTQDLFEPKPFKLSSVKFHASYYASVPAYTWQYDQEIEEFTENEHYNKHSFSKIEDSRLDLRDQLSMCVINNLAKIFEDMDKNLEVDVFINGIKFEYKCDLSQMKEFEINKNSTRQEIVVFGEKYNLLDQFIKKRII